jgi:hypothetical protein
MRKLPDANYFSARLEAELDAAARATCERARAAHLALAEAYRQRLAACSFTPEGMQPPPAATTSATANRA